MVAKQTDLEVLHEFAKKLGLRREWFQARGTFPHYDLTPNKRVQAIALGAVDIQTREQLKELYATYRPPGFYNKPLEQTISEGMRK